ncbi:MAG: L,D-transpeptidase family protein [Janthinobacterium lividum]
MIHRAYLATALATAVVAPCSPSWAAAPPPLGRDAVDHAEFSPLPDRSSERAVAEVVKAEILLDRTRFSPGAIDGIDGENFRKALSAYRRQMGLPTTGKLDQASWDRLTSGASVPLKAVTITEAEAKGPFTRDIPHDFEAQSKLKRLGYHDLREELGERYHMSPTLLMALNPGSRFAAGQTIVVAAINDAKPTDKVAKIVVDKAGHDVEALAADGRLIAFYPASIGSTEKPAPTGDYVIQRIAHNPDYTYSPKYHFKGVKAKTAFTIAPGPNNPVGLVWMDLSAEGGYGIHGTPNPEAVGKTQSHGCIRLTNWDALNLAAMVDKDTPVSFRNSPGAAEPAPAVPAPSALAAPAKPVP